MGESCPRPGVQTSLRSVCTHERGQDSLIQTDYARLIRFLLHGKQEKFNSFNETGLHLELLHVSRQNFTLHKIVM